MTTHLLPGFTKVDGAPDILNNFIILALDGFTKVGKTTFALTAPGPIAYLDLNLRAMGVIEPFSEVKDIYQIQIAVPQTTSKKGMAASGGLNVIQTANTEQCEAQWDLFVNSYKNALVRREIRSIIIDTATEAYDLTKLARFGRLQQVDPFHWGPVKREFADLVKMGYAARKNVLWIHNLKADFKTGQPKRDGLTSLDTNVQMNVTAYYDDDTNEYCVRIDDCGINAELNHTGEVLCGDMCSFPFLASLVYPETPPEVWGVMA